MAVKITHYDIGDVWQPQATFTVSGTPTDPTNITVRVMKPDGTVTVLGPVSGGTGGSGITRVSAGVFKITQSLDTAGYWFARFEGTGAAAGTEEQEAIVDPSMFYNAGELSGQALVGLGETKEWLRVRNIDTSNDIELARIINDVSDRFIFETGGREFKVVGTNPQSRDFEMEQWNWRIRTVPIGDLSTLTSASIVTYSLDGSVADTTALSNLVSLPRIRQTWEPITSILFPISIIQPAILYRAVLRVTGNWGFPSVPGNVRQAILNAVAAVMDRDVEHYRQDLATVTPSPGQGGEAGNVILMAQRQQKLLSLPPATMAVAWSFRGDSVLI